jgi:hypothetical protein
MGSLFKMVGKLRMSLDMIYIMGLFISFTFLFAFYHFEHIYLICGKNWTYKNLAMSIQFFLPQMGVHVHYHIIWTRILLMLLKPHDLFLGLVVCNKC